MKRFDLKSLMCGMLIGIMLFGSVGVAAAKTGGETIQVAYNNIKIMLNGNEFIPTDTDGTVLEPFVYNGRTYLPVRAVAEAVGLPVDWDNATKTVLLGENNTPSYSATSLTKIPYTKSDFYKVTGEIKDNKGNVYKRGSVCLGGYSFNGYVEYDLNGEYAKLSGTQILSDKGKNENPQGYYEFVTDGTKVKKMVYLLKGDDPVNFEIDLNGVKTLRINSQNDGRGDCNWLANVELYK